MKLGIVPTTNRCLPSFQLFSWFWVAWLRPGVHVLFCVPWVPSRLPPTNLEAYRSPVKDLDDSFLFGETVSTHQHVCWYERALGQMTPIGVATRVLEDARTACVWTTRRWRVMPRPASSPRPSRLLRCSLLTHSHPFDLMVVPYWSISSHGPKRFPTFISRCFGQVRMFHVSWWLPAIPLLQLFSLFTKASFS